MGDESRSMAMCSDRALVDLSRGVALAGYLHLSHLFPLNFFDGESLREQ